MDGTYDADVLRRTTTWTDGNQSTSPTGMYDGFSSDGQPSGRQPYGQAHPSKRDKRKTQNRMAQRAFRERKKERSDEVSARIDYLERLTESQSRTIASMSQRMERIEEENERLRIAAGGSSANLSFQQSGSPMEEADGVDGERQQADGHG